MIQPTIGRVVWYFPSDYDFSGIQSGTVMQRHSDQPFDAHIVHVWSDTCVNLVVFDHDGNTFKRTSVAINVEGATPRAEWMPYQQGQAAKHAAEAKA